MNKHNFSIKDVILFGWEKTKVNYLYVLQVMVFAGLALYIARSVARPIEVIIMLCLGISLTTVFLMITRGQGTTFGDLFKKYKGYEIFLNYVLASLLFGVLVGIGTSLAVFIIFVMKLLGFVVGFSNLTAGGILWIVLFILSLFPAAYVVVRLQFYKFFIIDKEMGPVPALKSSWKMTKGHTLKLSQYIVTIAIINVAVGFIVATGGIIFSALLLVTTPVIGLATARLYDLLSE